MRRSANGASFKGAVLWPPAPNTTTRDQRFGHEATCDGDHQTCTFERAFTEVPTNDFVFVVMTSRRGEAPQPAAPGEREKLRATVGGHTIFLDGGKLDPSRFTGDVPVVGALVRMLQGNLGQGKLVQPKPV